MSIRRLSRLWRELGATEPLFTVTTSHGVFDDHDITSLTITRGDGTPYGVQSTAATIGLRHDVGQVTDMAAPATVSLTSYGAALLSEATGHPAASLAPRFHGRLVSLTVDDHDDHRRTSTIDAGAWLNDLQSAGSTTSIMPDRTHMRTIISDVIGTYLPGTADFVAHGAQWSNRVVTGTGEHNVPPSDVLGWITDLGHLLRTRRDGTIEALSHHYRWETQSLAWESINPEPLTRRQVLSPVQWRQPAVLPLDQRWWQKNDDGSDAYYYETNAPDNGPLLWLGSTLPEIDLRGFNLYGVDDAAIRPVMRARLNAAAAPRYRLESVRVDLVRLLSSAHASDRAQAGQLLELEAGDALPLAYDWPDPVMGLTFATSITESITGAGYDVALELAPAETITGRPSPPVHGRTWETAYPAPTTWDTPPTTWETT